MQWIISDVHGCCYTLKKLLKRVRRKDKEAQLVFVGDYQDRGLHSKEAMQVVIEEQKNGAVCLRGNHDDVIDWIVNGESASPMEEQIIGNATLLTVGSWWLLNGFGVTMKSYGVDIEKHQSYDLSVIFRDFISKVPIEHKKFLRNLPLYWENETHFACHAYMRPWEELPINMKFMKSDRAYDTLWTRFRLTSITETPWDKIGVFGHSPVRTVYGHEDPIKHDKIRLIDTGVFLPRGSMTAYCCESDDWINEPTDKKDTEEI